MRLNQRALRCRSFGSGSWPVAISCFEAVQNDVVVSVREMVAARDAQGLAIEVLDQILKLVAGFQVGPCSNPLKKAVAEHRVEADFSTERLDRQLLQNGRRRLGADGTLVRCTGIS